MSGIEVFIAAAGLVIGGASLLVGGIGAAANVAGLAKRRSSSSKSLQQYDSVSVQFFSLIDWVLLSIPAGRNGAGKKRQEHRLHERKNGAM
jgi:hypothetical protein